MYAVWLRIKGEQKRAELPFKKAAATENQDKNCRVAKMKKPQSNQKFSCFGALGKRGCDMERS
ncbi:hypothetical protein [Spongorhabdus nitratireducens]